MAKKQTRRAAPQRVPVLTLTKPEVVPITPEQYEQAVATMASMILKWAQQQQAASTQTAPEADIED